MTAVLPPRIEVTDADLVLRARAGDRLAFDELYGRHADRVTAVCRARVSGSDVDDVVQDAFIKAWERIEQLAEPEAFGAWIRAIAARLCIDLHRGSGRTIATDNFDDHVDITGGSDDALLRREAAALVHAQMEVLSERDREALFLRDGMDASITELADRFDLSEGSTRVMLSRARTRLRQAWAAVLAWFVGLRALRNLAGSTPQMVAAGVAIAAVPLLAVPTLTGNGPLAGVGTPDVKVQAPAPAAPAPVGPVEADDSADVTTDTSGSDAEAEERRRPTAPAPAPVDEAPAAPESEVLVETAPVGDSGSGITLERGVDAGDQGEAAEVEANQGEEQGGVQVFAGNVSEFVDETVNGEDEEGDASDDGAADQGEPCILTCD